MKSFNGRHVVYGIVAIFCSLTFVIIFPLLLLLEPILKRRFNFIRIKPLIDQLQGSFKDKHSWFASYYLICRLVIIAYSGSIYFENRLYYLYTNSLYYYCINSLVDPTIQKQRSQHFGWYNFTQHGVNCQFDNLIFQSQLQ